jgi:hypothetical protein
LTQHKSKQLALFHLICYQVKYRLSTPGEAVDMKQHRKIHAVIALALLLAALMASSASARVNGGVGGIAAPAVAVHLRGSLAEQPSTFATGGSGFRWDDAGIGAAIALLLVGVVGGATVTRRRTGRAV